MQRSNSWIVILIILLSTAAVAQTGSIAGSVTDPSGAVLPNVQITVRNLATNAFRVATSSDVGSCTIRIWRRGTTRSPSRHPASRLSSIPT